MHTHPTPADIRYHATIAIRAAAEAWEDEAGRPFPATAAIRAMNAGVNAAIAEHEAATARLHNARTTA